MPCAQPRSTSRLTPLLAALALLMPAGAVRGAPDVVPGIVIRTGAQHGPDGWGALGEGWLALGARVATDWRPRFRVEGRIVPDPRLRLAELSVEPWSALGGAAGLLVVPLLDETTRSPWRQRTWERPLIGGIMPENGLGLRVGGEIYDSSVTYQAGVFGGAPDTTGQPPPWTVGRLDGRWSTGALTLDGAVAAGIRPTHGPHEGRRVVTGTLGLRWRWVEASGALVHCRIEPARAVALTARSWIATLSAELPGDAALVVRAERLWHGAIDETQVTAAVAWQALRPLSVHVDYVRAVAGVLPSTAFAYARFAW